MEMRELGRSGVKVSAVALGTMTFGGQTSPDEAFAQLDLARDVGINFFDAAENYPAPPEAETQGRTEEILGAWVAKRGVRDRVVLATKVTGPSASSKGGPGAMAYIRGADRRLDRRNIEAAVDASLARLQTDYIDLYQLHWPDRPIATASRPWFVDLADPPQVVPIEDTLEALGDLVKAGKVRHVGVCNETPWGVMRYLGGSSASGRPRLASVQNGYSLLDRRFELGLAEVAMREQVGLLAYSPLAGGQLTGKHLRADPSDAGGRMSFPGLAKRYGKASLASAVAAYVEIAERHGLSPAAMALAFVRQQPFVTAALMAASSFAQLNSNLESLEVTLSPEIIKEINAVHDENPSPIR